MKDILFLTLIFIGLFAIADTPNAFNSRKLSTEALVTGIEGCTSGFEKGRKAQGRWNGTNDEKILAVYSCGCFFDGQQQFPNKNLSSFAQICLDDMSKKIANSHKGVQFRLNNLFNKDVFSSSAVQSAFYSCEDKENKNKNHNWPKKFGQKSLYCSCLVDYMRELKDLTLTKYVESDISFNTSIEKQCMAIAKVRK